MSITQKKKFNVEIRSVKSCIENFITKRRVFLNIPFKSFINIKSEKKNKIKKQDLPELECDREN